jgi:hypothetical protein
MTPADEVRFIELWQQGASYRDLAQALGCALGTVGSRASALVTQGKISPRPRGGAYPKQKALAQLSPDGTPAAPTTPAPPAPQVAPAVTFVAVPEIQEILGIVKELQTRVASLEQTRVPPALPAPPATPATERKDIQQWTVRLSKALIDHLKAVAYERRIPPSQLVEELVWKALSDHQPSTP